LVVYPEGDHVCFNISYKYRPLTADWMAESLGALQGCSMHSTEAPFGQGLESSESGGVSVLTEGAGSVTA